MFSTWRDLCKVQQFAWFSKKLLEMKTKLDKCAVQWVRKVSCQLLMEVKRKVTSAFLSLLHFFSASAFSSGNNYDSAEVVLEKSIIWQIRQCDRQSKRMGEKERKCRTVPASWKPTATIPRALSALQIVVAVLQLEFACHSHNSHVSGISHFCLRIFYFLAISSPLSLSFRFGIVWSNWKKRIKTKKGKYFVVCTSLSHPPVECWKSFYTLRTLGMQGYTNLYKYM